MSVLATHKYYIKEDTYLHAKDDDIKIFSQILYKKMQVCTFSYVQKFAWRRARVCKSQFWQPHLSACLVGM